MSSFMPVASALALLTLAGCQGRPPKPVQPYYDGPLGGREHIRVDAAVPHPAVTRFGAFDSRLPYYGLLATRVDPATPAFGRLPVDRILDVPATVRRHIATAASARPALAARIDAEGSLRLSLRIDAIGIFARDLQRSNCQPMVVMRAQVVDAAGKLRWSSGYGGNRLDERINYPCAALATDRALAAKALDEALRAGVGDIIGRL